MELKNYTTSEVREFIKQTQNNFQYAVFYPNTIFELRRELSFLTEKIKQSIQEEDGRFKLIEQAHKGFEAGFNKFLLFKNQAFEFGYNADDFGSFEDLLGELINNKIISPLTQEDKNHFQSFFLPLANIDILLSEEEFKEIARALKINFSDKNKYKVIFTRINTTSLNKDKEISVGKTYPDVKSEFIGEVGELTLYPNGHLYENDKLIYKIDTLHGFVFDFVTYLITEQKAIGDTHITKDELQDKFGNGYINLIINTNNRLRAGDSKYIIKRKKEGNVHIGFGSDWVNEEIVKKVLSE